jgi:hypothetical protein
MKNIIIDITHLKEDLFALGNKPLLLKLIEFYSKNIFGQNMITRFEEYLYKVVFNKVATGNWREQLYRKIDMKKYIRHVKNLQSKIDTILYNVIDDFKNISFSKYVCATNDSIKVEFNYELFSN